MPHKTRRIFTTIGYSALIAFLLVPMLISLSAAPLISQTVPEDRTVTYREAIENAGLDPAWVKKQMGKNKSYALPTGSSFEDKVTLGDLTESGALDSLTLDQVATATNTDTGSAPLSTFGLVNTQSFGSLEQTIPSLSTTKIKDIPVLNDAAKRRGINVDPNQTLGSLPPDSPLLTTPIKDLGVDLSQYPVSSVPGATTTPLMSYPGAKDATMSQVPGLAGSALNALFKSLVPGGFIATVDLPWSDKEAYRLNTITGSYREGFHVPCTQTNCAYIELTGNPTVKGRQWISGKSQKVKGGSGCLSAKEPTGRHPFGPGFKVVLTNVHEEKGTADFAAYLPLSLPCGHRLYILGPIPLFSVKEKEPLFVGLIEPGLPSVELPSTSDSTPPVNPTAPPTTAPTNDQSKPRILSALPNNSTQSVPATSINPSVQVADASGPPYKGVQVASLQLAFQKLDSTQGDYADVGPYLCDPQGTCSRAIGKYGTPSSSPSLRSAIASVPDGKAFLGKTANPKTPVTELTALAPQVLTPETQESLASDDLKRLIDTAHTQGYRDDKLIEKVAASHAGGVGSPIGDYSKNAVALYHSLAPGGAEEKANATPPKAA